MLKSMGERTPPCGTPDLNCRFVDVWFLNVVYANYIKGRMAYTTFRNNVCSSVLST